MATDRLLFDILARDRASKVFDKVSKSADRSNTVFGKLGRGVGAAAGFAAKSIAGLTVAAGAGLTIFAKGALEEAREAEQVGKTTAAIIKATGGAANVTAGQVANLTGKLSEQAGVDDELVQQGANLLLTFRNIRNEAGKNNAIFDRATAAAVDLADAGFGSITSTSKQLGKALNDPIKGMNALTRAGVTFSAAQQKQIKGFVEAGDILSAQKVILAEVEAQVGGVAAASATAGEKAAVAWANFQETVGTAVLPLVDDILEGFTAILPKVLEVGKSVTSKLAPAFKTASDLVGGFIRGLQGGEAFGSGPLAAVVNHGKAIRDAFIAVLPSLKSLWTGISTQLVPAFADLFGKIQPVAASLLKTLAPAFSSIVGFVKSLIPAFAGVASAIGTFIAAIVPVIQPFIQQIVGALGPGLKAISAIITGQLVPAFSAFLAAITPIVKFIVSIVGPTIVGAFKGIIQAVQGALTIVSGLLNFFAALFTGNWSKLWDSVKQIASGAWQLIQGAFKVFINVGLGKIFALGGKLLVKIGGKVFGALRGLFSRGWDTLKRLTGRGIDAVVKFVKALPGKAVAALRSLASKLASVILRAWRAARTATSNQISGLLRTVRALPGRIRRGLGNIGRLLVGAGRSLINGLVSGIRAAAGRAVSAARGVVSDAVGAAKRLLGIGSPSKVFIEIGADTTTGFAKGIEAGLPNVKRMFAGLTNEVSRSALPARSSLASQTFQPAQPTGTTPTVVNVTFSGPVGSQYELRNWLARSIDDLNRQGRLSGISAS